MIIVSASTVAWIKIYKLGLLETCLVDKSAGEQILRDLSIYNFAWSHVIDPTVVILLDVRKAWKDSNQENHAACFEIKLPTGCLKIVEKTWHDLMILITP